MYEKIIIFLQRKPLPKPVIMRYTGPNIKKPDYMSDSTALLKTIEDDMVVAEDENKAVPSEHLPANVYVIPNNFEYVF